MLQPRKTTPYERGWFTVSLIGSDNEYIIYDYAIFCLVTHMPFLAFYSDGAKTLGANETMR